MGRTWLRVAVIAVAIGVAALLIARNFTFTTTETRTVTVTTTETRTQPTMTTTVSTPATTETRGDPVAGKAIFTGVAACAACHTLADAGAAGNVGPNLDQAKPPYSKIVTRVTNGRGAMPAFKGFLTPQQIADVAAYVGSVAGK